MEPDEREDFQALLAYDEDTAAGLMSTSYIAISASLRVSEGLARLRALEQPPDLLHDLYLVDDDGESLLGVLSLATALTVTEAFDSENAVSRTFLDAPDFQGLFSGLLLVGAAMARLPGKDVINLLIGTQMRNGLLLRLVLESIQMLVNDARVMGEHVNGRLYNLLAWSTVAFTVLLSSAYLAITMPNLVTIPIG
jgi:Mn2+/Fe2+ NRAMP family transporter